MSDKQSLLARTEPREPVVLYVLKHLPSGQREIVGRYLVAPGGSIMDLLSAASKSGQLKLKSGSAAR
jgi:hypothetical protein